MTDWIFQANHPVDDEVAEHRIPRWNTPHHRHEITIDDRVRLQVSGRHSPGLYYVATVVSEVYESMERVDRGRPGFGRWRTDVKFKYRIDPPVSRARLLNDRLLGSFRPFGGFQASNKRIPEEIAARLAEIADLTPL